MNHATGKLEEVDAFHVKPQERSTNFNIFPFPKFIISDQFLVLRERIFYLYRNKILPDGVLDMELLSDKDDERENY